eukprot:TRINITY_DN16636_c0_g1_i1.p1 TRINITY_DN16636_c0_g1~~TRINITY_DN16636_c0_g1_i1.p1  ORF type:complete len:223 (+),score=55.62 TRINITY_DN16636_c0_g1_i1:49-717(+)
MEDVQLLLRQAAVLADQEATSRARESLYSCFAGSQCVETKREVAEGVLELLATAPSGTHERAFMETLRCLVTRSADSGLRSRILQDAVVGGLSRGAVADPRRRKAVLRCVSVYASCDASQREAVCGRAGRAVVGGLVGLAAQAGTTAAASAHVDAIREMRSLSLISPASATEGARAVTEILKCGAVPEQATQAVCFEAIWELTAALTPGALYEPFIAALAVE